MLIRFIFNQIMGLKWAYFLMKMKDKINIKLSMNQFIDSFKDP